MELTTGSSTTPPAATLAVIEAAPTGSTPMTAVRGDKAPMPIKIEELIHVKMPLTQSLEGVKQAFGLMSCALLTVIDALEILAGRAGACARRAGGPDRCARAAGACARTAQRRHALT